MSDMNGMNGTRKIGMIWILSCLLLLCCPTGQAQEEKFRGTEGWHKTVWGMNTGEVLEIYPAATMTEFGLFVPGKVAGKQAGVGLYFVEDQLYRVEVAFTLKHVNPREYLNDLSTVKDLIARRYPDPPRVKMIWHDEGLKGNSDQWGAAIVYGDLEIHTRWETDQSEVTLFCQGKDFSVEMTTVYESKKLAFLAEEQKVYLAGRARSWARAVAGGQDSQKEEINPVILSVEKALAGTDMQTQPAADETELRRRYSMVKSARVRRGKEMGAEVVLAAGVQDWPQEFTLTPPGPQGVLMATNRMELGASLSLDDLDALEKQREAGNLFFVANLTRGKVKNTMTLSQMECTEVEILEGSQQGKTGWVFMGWVY